MEFLILWIVLVLLILAFFSGAYYYGYKAEQEECRFLERLDSFNRGTDRVRDKDGTQD